MRLKMVGVEFSDVGPGTCSWCGKGRKEVFTVVINHPSFPGPKALCFSDFRHAMTLMLNAEKGKSVDPSDPATRATA
jgi:hypothetical protein